MTAKACRLPYDAFVSSISSLVVRREGMDEHIDKRMTCCNIFRLRLTRPPVLRAQ